MNTWAKPGVKCVCIRVPESWSHRQPGEVAPVLRQHLTVRTTEIVSGQLALTFVEIMNEPKQYLEGFVECVFAANNFRPIIEQSDDVALFAHHLDQVGEPA